MTSLDRSRMRAHALCNDGRLLARDAGERHVAVDVRTTAAQFGSRLHTVLVQLQRVHLALQVLVDAVQVLLQAV